MVAQSVRTYVSLRASGDLLHAYQNDDREAVLRHITQAVLERQPQTFCRMADLPSLKALRPSGGPEEQPAVPQEVVVSLEVDPGTLDRLRGAYASGGHPEVVGAGVDLPVYSTRHWCPGGGGRVFGDREAAERLIGVSCLRERALTGKGVNVVVVDHGLDAEKIRFGGGWPGGLQKPGKSVGGHGMAMVRQIASVAPHVTFYDYPVLPPRITRLPGFLSQVTSAYQYLRDQIAEERKKGNSRWVVVNAWSVFDRKPDPGNGVDTTFDPLNVQVGLTAEDGVDLIFAAGNCGQFAPDPRCGSDDRGPGASVIGANSHPAVLTVGATRTDALWLGYSSQGPGQFKSQDADQPKLAKEKPDLCAPSEFRETADASILNTGTSTACALAAGVVAALRQEWDGVTLSPAALKALLTETARRPEGARWSARLGHGIIDVEAALRSLTAKQSVA